MKKLIKSLIPPIMLDKFYLLSNYKYFLKYKDLISKNIELKDKHRGKRCFLLGIGPSIKKENLKPLKDQIVFALNNFYVHDDFAHIMSGDVEKYYMTAPIHPPQTEDEWKAWFEDMENNIPKDVNMLFGLNKYDGNIKNIIDKYDIFKEHKINWYFAGIPTNEYYNFSQNEIDLTNMVLNANTVSIYALLASIYMGFDEIYLLGMDHNYMCKSEVDSRFYKHSIHQKDQTKRISDMYNYKSYNKILLEGMVQIFNHYQILNENSNCKIYNTSKDSLLDIFDFRNFKKIVED